MDRAFPGRILAAIRRGLARAGRALASAPGALAAAGRALLRLPRAIGEGLRGFWRSLSAVARRRLGLALAAIVALVLFFGLAVPNLPCQLPGGDFCPPADDAQELVPADALAYLHANLDPEEEDYEHALAVGERLPLIGGEIVDRAVRLLPGPAGRAPDFEAEIEPWFGGEAAIAILPGSGDLEQVALLEVDDAEAADAFADRIVVGGGNVREHEGVELTVGPNEVATAQTDDFLVIGSEAGVEAVVDTATLAEDAEPLSDDETATEVRDELPEHRFAEVYLSEDGVGDLLAEAGGTLRSLSPLLGPGASRGAAASLTATEDTELELAVRSVLDPKRAKSAPGFFAAFPRFEPELPGRLADDSLAYLGFGEPRTAVGALLSQAGEQAPGVAAGFEALVEGVRDSGVDIERDLLDSLGAEAAFALAPQPAEAGPALPFLEFVASGVDEEAARRALAALQAPLADSVNPGSAGQAPVFGQDQIDGVETRSLRISPAVELTYAVFDDLASIATDPAGIEQLVSGDDSLDDAERYERATEDFADEVSLIAYFDLGELVALGERLGLAEDPLYATFAGDFRSLNALGLAVSSSDELLATDARLLLGDGDAERESAAPAPVPSD